MILMGLSEFLENCGSILLACLDLLAGVFLCVCTFSRCFLMIFSVRPVQVFRKLCLIAFRRIAVVGLKSDACKYWDSSGFEVCARMLFTKFSDFFGPRGTSQIPVFLFLVPLIIYSPLFCIDFSVYCDCASIIT